MCMSWNKCSDCNNMHGATIKICSTVFISFAHCIFSSSFGSAEFETLVYIVLSFSVIQGIASVVSSSFCVFCVSKSGNCVLYIL
jgi:hypothetical protein